MPPLTNPRSWPVVVLASMFAVPVALAAPSPEPVVASLELEEALSRLAEDSPTATQLAGRVAEAQALVKLSSAAALPVIAARGGYTRNRDEAGVSMSEVFEEIGEQLPVEIDTTGLPGDLIIQPLEQWTAAATVSVPLLAPQAWADVGAARKGVEAASAGTRSVAQRAEAGLVKAAWMSRAAEQRLLATTHAEEAARAHRDRAARRVDAGTGTPLELLVAETELSRRESEAVQAVADLDSARRAQGALLGLAGPVNIEVGAPAGLPRSLSADAASSLALGSRPNLLGARSAAEAASRSKTSAWLRHSPTISASGSIFASDVAYPTGEQDGWRLGLDATWVLFDGGARYGLLDRARAQELQAEGSIAQLELDAERQARDAVAAVHVARARLDLATRGAETARAAEASAARLYEAGLLDHLDAIDAVQRRLEAELGLAAATAQVGVAQAELGLATGTGWSSP